MGKTRVVGGWGWKGVGVYHLRGLDSRMKGQSLGMVKDLAARDGPNSCG